MFSRGQVSSTMNWVIATIIIIVVLLISYFATANNNFLNPSLSLKDKEKDLIATKSIISFVEDNYDLIKTSVDDKDYQTLNNTLSPFLLDISLLNVEVGPVGKSYAWNVNLLDADDQNKFSIYTYSAMKRAYSVTIVLDENNKLNFWEACTLC